MMRLDHTIIVLLICVVSLFASCANHKEAIKAQVDRLYEEACHKKPLPPHRFESDGCSLWWDGNWWDCCVVHDFCYWMGGSRKERKECDFRLMHCIADKDKRHPFMARVMYLGVRIGGVPWLNTTFRWGFGWEYPQTGSPDKLY